MQTKRTSKKPTVTEIDETVVADVTPDTADEDEDDDEEDEEDEADAD